MVVGSSKRIVVIRDIPSNFIEEAIFILKSEPGEKVDAAVKEINSIKPKKDNDFIIKEAELIINNYIRENKLQAGSRRDRLPRIGIFKGKLSANAMINIGLIGCIVFLIFLIIKVI